MQYYSVLCCYLNCKIGTFLLKVDISKVIEHVNDVSTYLQDISAKIKNRVLRLKNIKGLYRNYKKQRIIVN